MNLEGERSVKKKVIPNEKPGRGLCVIRVDRAQVHAKTFAGQLPRIPHFQLIWDRFVRPQTSPQTYRRVRSLKNTTTDTTLWIQYWPILPGLRPAKLTLIANDRKGLRRPELEQVIRQFEEPRLLTVELAFDFSKASGVDRGFVLRHGVFGKSRIVGGGAHQNARLGGRDSDTMVRVYPKGETSSFRVEIELHSSWLRRNNVIGVGDLPKLADLLLPKRLLFVQIDWESLSRHLARKGLPAAKLVSEAKLRSHSIHETMKFLRNEVGLCNVRRFLRPLRINRPIQRELQIWANGWRRSFKQCVGGPDA